MPTGPGVGLTSVSLGLLRALDRRGVRVGFVKPVAQPRGDGRSDHTTELVRNVTSLLPPEPIAPERLERELGQSGDFDLVLEEVVAAWQPVHDSAEVVIAEGLSPGPTHLYSSSLNQALARTVDAGVLVVTSWPGDGDAGHDPVHEVVESIAITGGRYVSGERGRVAGCVVNRMPEDEIDGEAGRRLRRELEARRLPLVATIPNRPELAWPRVTDLVGELGAKVLREGDLSRRIKDIAVFAQAVPGGLHVLTDGRLVVVPGDRHDVVMAACLATLNGTRLAALLLTTGIAPDPRVWELTEAAAASGLSILLVDDYTYETATRVHQLDPELPVDDRERAEAVMETVADAFDQDWLETLPSSTGDRRLSPAAFRYRVAEWASAANARLVLPEGSEPRTVEAAITCAERGIVTSVLLADPDEVAATLRSLGLDLPDGDAVRVLDPTTAAEGYVATLVELRGHKGMTTDMAREALADPVTVGTMMLHAGEVDGLVSGAVHTTADTVRPALQILRTKEGARLVSSVFFMCLPDEVLVYGDCAINPNPNVDELADIAIQSAASARAFGIEPRVAMISFSTGTSGGGADVEKVAEATRLVRQREPDLAVDGPLQYDAAVVASVGLSKRPGSSVAGRANVFIFPDLDTGNTTYKAVQRSADVVSIGPMLQGLAKPVNDLSRGALVEDIVYTMALTAIQARAD